MKPKKQTNSRRKAVTDPVVQETALEPIVQVPATQPEAKVIKEVIAIRQPNRLFFLALLMGWLFDFLFWEQSVGVNFALLFAFCLLGGIYLLFSEGYKPSRNSLWLLIPSSFFAVVAFVRQESLTIFLAYIFTVFSLGLFVTSYLGGCWASYGLYDYFSKSLLLLNNIMARPISLVRQTQNNISESDSGRKSLPIAGVIRGLLIALPILLCFGSLLASADVVFSQRLDNFFDTEKIADYIIRLVLVMIFAYLFAGAILHSITSSQDEKITEESRSIIKPFLGFTESVVVLGSVFILFLAFVTIQFQYFFGGQTNIGVEGYTYSEYARRGFNELVTVAFFSLVMILGLSALTRREDETQKKVYAGLSVGVVALVMVILLSAYQRISLAIDWHGFSRLRLYPRIFLVWLGILLVVVVVLEIYRRQQYFAFSAVLASLGFAVSLTLTNVDAAIVMHNVPRTLQGKNLNVAHLASLSVDAVPSLADEFYSASYPEWVHEGVGAALTCYLHRDLEEEVSWDNWPSFNLSRWRAHHTLQNVERYLQDYGVNDEQSWNVKVRTPSKVWYECRYFESSQED